jgi:hypothetical protein
MIYVALVMALIGQLWFLAVAWKESKLLVAIILAPTVMAYLMQTGLLHVSKWTFLITAAVAGLVIIGFAIYHFDRTWMPVLMILGGNIWFHQQGGLGALERDVQDKKGRIKKPKPKDDDGDDEETWRRPLPSRRGRTLAQARARARRSAQNDRSMPASCSFLRAASARRQGPMASAPSTVPARATMGTRVAMRETKPEARVSSTHRPMPTSTRPLTTVPPRAAQPRVLKIFTAKNTATTPPRIISHGTRITQGRPMIPTSLS